MFLKSLSLVLIFSIETLFAVTINGAGASFPAPIYKRWAIEYEKVTGTRINYESTGSGAGIKSIIEKTVDFGASDEPLKKDELNTKGLTQFPVLIGGIVLIVNLDNVKPGELKLSSEVLSQIFLGKISKWNDAKITALNPNIKLPSIDITVVHRSDGSGTTWIFTNYLSKISEEWAKGPGNDKSVAWPTGLGGQKNAGVAATVQRIKGSIGYVEFAYAEENKLAYTMLQNKEGKFIAPTIKTFSKAAASADWSKSEDFYMILTLEKGKESWPIVGATYILLEKDSKKKEISQETLKFFDWGFTGGKKLAMELNYVPLPEKLIQLIKKSWKANIK